MKFLVSIFLLSFSLHGLCSLDHANILDVSQYQKREGAEYLEQLARGEYVLASPTFIVSSSDHIGDYPSGDFYIMWGFKPAEMDRFTHGEYLLFWNLINRLTKEGFRVVLNVRATNADLLAAVRRQGTSVVVWSSHGADWGFVDFNSKKIGYEVFRKKAKSMYQFIVNACYSEVAKKHYAPPKDLLYKGWPLQTNANDMFSYMSGDWTPFDGKNLGPRH